MKFRTILLAACGFVIWTAFTSAHAQEKLLAPQTLPGEGVLDPASKVGYFPNTTGGIDAVTLKTGATLWSSKEANRPLFASENRLYAMKGKGNKIHVVALDSVKGGQKIFESPPIALPDWVTVDVVHGRTFRPGARLSQTGLLLIWEARAFYAGGAAPTPEITEQARKHAVGVVRIDAATGKAKEFTPQEVAAGKFIPLAEQMALIVGDFTYRTADEPGRNPANPFQQRRFLEAVNPSMEVVWRREIAAPVMLLPLP